MRLSPQQVVAAALTVLDEVGLEGLSVRRVSVQLGLGGSALYLGVANRNGLLTVVAEHLLDQALAEPAAGSGAARIQATAGLLRRTLLAHRDGARLVATVPTPLPTARRVTRRLMEALVEAGIGLESVPVGAETLLHFVLGSVLGRHRARPAPVPVGR